MKYLLDTNILLVYLRDRKTKSYIDKYYQPFELPNIPIISVVSVGELKALALKNNWGENRIQNMNTFLNELLVADINAVDVIERYAEIDAFSQGKLAGKQLAMSSRNMGKNDLWIVATASVSNSTLMTTDWDFDHLDKHYLDLVKISIEK